jgi:GGDEF domain-containing protein
MNRKHLKLQLSAGGGFAADYEFNLNRLLEQVDAAMYEAKQEKRSDINWCQSGSHRHRHRHSNTLQNDNKNPKLETPFMEYVNG